jgi:uncharacterized OB-fold protein
MKTRVPFREGLFEETAGKGALLGVRCRRCGQIIFPGREVCLNCLGQDLEPVHLGRGGKLYTYTIVHMPSEHFQPPYAIGWIELPEGIKVFSQIRGWQEHPLETGMDMELSFEKYYDEADKEIIGYVFRPSRNEEEA